MARRPAFLRTKVARRIFLSFVVSALLPITVLAIVAYWHVAGQLETQGRERLRAASQAVGQGILERLTFLHTEMASLAATLPDVMPPDWRPPPTLGVALQTRLSGLAVADASRPRVQVFGEGPDLHALDSAQRTHLAEGGMLLWTTGPPGARRIHVAAGPGGGRWSPTLWADVRLRHVWGGAQPEAALPSGVDLCLMDAARTVLDCSRRLTAAAGSTLVATVAGRHAGDFTWADDRDEYLAGFWSPVLHLYQARGSRNGSMQWHVVLSERKTAVLASMTRFKRTFPLVFLLALWVVLLLSNIQIRRSTSPLDALQEATQRLAQRDFSTPVRVQSGDEFEHLAGSFNTMAGELREQFGRLTAMNALDRAVLSMLDRSVIIDAVLSHGAALLGGDAMVVGVAEHDHDGHEWTLVATARGGAAKRQHRVRPTHEDLAPLRASGDAYVVATTEQLPPFLAGALDGDTYHSFTVLPLRLQERTAGVIVVAYRTDPAHGPEALTRARQVVDQMAVALTNARLFEQLEHLKVGALTALARTIDAKSPWTAGHSERVTASACLLAAQLEMSGAELEVVRRGSLLHDIGKIGISAAILDKAGDLTTEEMREMQAHPEIGARILSPIEAYGDVLSIVLYHHERMNGQGYPAGLRGDAIPFHARIVAVADVYDALTSDRPYRGGWARQRAIAWIRSAAGPDLDPDVVAAFLRAVREDVTLGAAEIPAQPRLQLEDRKERV